MFSQKEDQQQFSQIISAEKLRSHLQILASDSLEGRETGRTGQKKAAAYIASQFKKYGLQSLGDTNYLQKIHIPRDSISVSRRKPEDSLGIFTENVIGYIEGTDLKDEYVIISAHYDHLGIYTGTTTSTDKIFNGADDNGSGTSAIINIAEAFMKAKKEGKGPRRSILIIAFTGEEKGLLGSKYYVRNPLLPLDKAVADINIDMVGRVDDKPHNEHGYIYTIGSDRISKDLKKITEAANEKYTKLKIDYYYDKKDDTNRFYYRSDHYNFAKNGIPVVFFFNGVHADYHKESDEISKINFNLMEVRARLAFYTAWEVANREKRLKK